MPKNKDAAPDPSLIILRAPEGVTGCSVAGFEYEVEEGLVAVDVKHVDQLLDIGFTR